MSDREEESKRNDMHLKDEAAINILRSMSTTHTGWERVALQQAVEIYEAAMQVQEI